MSSVPGSPRRGLPRRRGDHETTSLTADEREALSVLHNLADAHTRHAMTPREHRVLKRFSGIFDRSLGRDYQALVLDACKSYSQASGQTIEHDRVVATYSASISIMIAARALKRSRGARAYLTWPTFDNISALLAGEGFAVVPRRWDQDITELDRRDVVFEVTPNNPTGEFRDSAELKHLAEACRRDEMVLVLDQSFRAHDASCCFDHHSILESAGVSYMVIEDTGKIWPLRDLKTSFLVTSADLFESVQDVADGVLLNVAPSLLELTVEFARLSEEDGFAPLRRIIECNRNLLREMVTDFHGRVSLPYPESRVGVELIAVPEVPGRVALRAATGRGLGVLDARKFYWSSEGQRDLLAPSETMFRIALCRDPDDFACAITELAATLRRLLGDATA